MRLIKIINIVCCLIVIAVNVSFSEEDILKYDDQGKRDPMLPLVSADGIIENFDDSLSISDLSLEGVMLGDGDSSLVIINGKIVKIKDKIGDFTVHEIKSEKVYLIKGNKIFELQLKKEE
ncbi:MAG: hypothetical protein A2Y03_11305 [Omnitrophica WOR_2 bacterium GWF2_38_59]|nr:MAG: hypothetical protein A2Y06_05630 [Omnitrophica WOR_2 bacterium GWA2_37_7]OGX25264.1 MAG: hypothetical protein A2Y03_11305 [Omnitrophica WOR_2 bacterium GWF2_38_59]OGX47936.1 MAG: hypothetical protein A2243_01160 [Omnitrophica WOR_2 bacterium RIFOXYA2_FULL_38_17]OGX52416.1 MAG: hypothetical protein A2267_03960 [Omnitrophica WOR_2 bacterium RIFOXYA12_FULL_38_10]OGX56273.1 MAG: hypothetical protein A2447_08480 [Omnitrophica WOR_2 bacterium RIFOXYC2_FULL_38_12]OGX60222.1 MAG: hypothetical 